MEPEKITTYGLFFKSTNKPVLVDYSTYDESYYFCNLSGTPFEIDSIEQIKRVFVYNPFPSASSRYYPSWNNFNPTNDFYVAKIEKTISKIDINIPFIIKSQDIACTFVKKTGTKIESVGQYISNSSSLTNEQLENCLGKEICYEDGTRRILQAFEKNVDKYKYLLTCSSFVY